MSLKQLLQRADEQLIELHDELPERFDFTLNVIARCHELALEHHAADAARIVENVTGPLSPNAGRRLLAAMMATLDTSELLNLQQAADYLGYKPSGLRKIAKRGDIRYMQVGQGPYKFRHEWLDEFVANINAPPPTTKRRKAPPRPPTLPIDTRYGFDPSLLDI